MATLLQKLKDFFSRRADSVTLVIPAGRTLVSSHRPLKNGDTEHTFWAE